ncbi:MAG: hypothetical protein ACRENP_24760 [Longimicrobiales bacterium]
MALFPAQLLEAQQRTQAGSAAVELTVRDFLRWFGAQRRGYFIVQTHPELPG